MLDTNVLNLVLSPLDPISLEPLAGTPFDVSKDTTAAKQYAEQAAVSAASAAANASDIAGRAAAAEAAKNTAVTKANEAAGSVGVATAAAQAAAASALLAGSHANTVLAAQALLTSNDLIDLKNSALNSKDLALQYKNQSFDYKEDAEAAAVSAQGYASIAQAVNQDAPIRLNTRLVSADFTIPAAYNGASAGPLEIAEGVTVTVADGATWSID